MNWNEEVTKRKEELIEDVQNYLRIKSVLDESTKSERAPFGEGIHKAYQHLLKLGEQEGFNVLDLDGYAGHIEMQGSGEEIVGILCHVDVVPEGDGWTSDPYAAEIRDGKIFARGALDDKGPTIAAFYAMKIVKELGLHLSKHVRMIIGTDEESDWRCVEHYFKHEKMPTLGFAPDADFPIIYAEKGIIDAKLTIGNSEEKESNGLVLKSFESGRRYNMVPDYAEAVMTTDKELLNMNELFGECLTSSNVTGEYKLVNNEYMFTIKGKSAHAMEPNNGVNAGLILASFLHKLDLDHRGEQYVKLIQDYFHHDTRGEKLGIAYADDISGDLTVNVGIISYQAEGACEIGINIRYPVTGSSDEIKAKLEGISGVELSTFNDSKPHHVDEKHPLIQTLQKVYEEQTGEKAELIAIGGGTYARSLEAGVAFGPLFPGRPDIAHQKDEYIEIEDLLKATAIYAQAIYELAK
ncbi:dipeptidase PepV [Metabacillus malikii]|uniref:Succinyl-diaminopimelate desuccinylase n=1 Tax=Metabacillus malikii TaxID=1504265 RepID=A0ABT9ZGX8_9BACI|nr:dipeptidase PepV [Metabacillus malikii]MDQ0231225.1 succinyl-diaminopimelate desuccinylase [Metabacillus malikii]